jgi:hypothetical protein
MRVAIHLRLPSRQAILFLIALVVPCAVFLAVGLRMLDQERQSDKKAAEERQRRIVTVRQELLAELERLKVRQLTMALAGDGRADSFRPDGDAVFVGPLKNGALILPWEDSPAAKRFHDALYDGDFAERIRESESLELVARDYDNAARQYRLAVGHAAEPAEKAYARLLLARSLRTAGRIVTRPIEPGLRGVPASS